MKKILFIIILGALVNQLVAQEIFYYQNNDTNDDTTLIVTEIDEFVVRLPKGCAYDPQLSKPDEGTYAWFTPNKDFMFVYCYFPFGDDFSQEERLIGEAAQMGVEILGDGDIASMKISDNIYLSFTFNDMFAIGVTRFYPDANIGMFYYAVTSDKNNNTLAFNVISSIRAKNDNQTIDHKETTKLVSMIHQCLLNEQYEIGFVLYKQLQKHVPLYIGLYENNVFALYMSICAEELNYKIGEEEVEKFYKMCTTGKNVSNQTRGKILANIAETLSCYNQYELSISYYQRMKELEEYIEPIYYYRTLFRMGETYYNYKMYQKAFIAYKACSDFFKVYFGNDSRWYALSLNKMAYVSLFINFDYLDLLLEEKVILENIHDTISDRYAICLDNIGAYYHIKKRDDSTALNYCLKANSIFHKLDSIGGDYALSLNNIGAIYKGFCIFDSSYFRIAEDYLLRSVQIAPTSRAALNLALFYQDQIKDMGKALKYYDYLEDYDRHNVSANLLAMYYAKIGDFSSYASYMTEYIDYLRLVQQRNVQYMTKKERDSYIDVVQNQQMAELFDFAAETRHDSLAGICYNYLLLSKSLLLSYDASIENLVEQSTNKELHDMYFTLGILRHNAIKSEEARIKADSLEHTFLELLSKEANFSAFTSLKYQDIQRNLAEDDVAIEFFENIALSNSKLYAVILTSNNIPEVVICPKVIHNALNNTYDNNLATSIWDAIKPHVTNKNRIFFSASGILHQIAIENLPYDSIHTIGDIYNMVRLSSTRDLVLHKQNITPTSAALFGGINYDATPEDLYAHRIKPIEDEEEKQPDNTLIAYNANRDSKKPLPGTKIEVREIDKVLTEANVHVQRDTAEIATEEAFKALSGKHKHILHLATHGFYWQDSTAQKEKYFTQRAITMDNTNVPMSIDPLERCGLLFAGANTTLDGKGKRLEEYGVQDGVLTAKEISTMDLRDAELVVLSACETGLGDITGDGVFGLQRAFKMAGAQTIIMSLWKVDDHATQLLMSEFYKNWVTNKGKLSKREAFRKAQDTVRSQYCNPVDWAGFIILD